MIVETFERIIPLCKKTLSGTTEQMVRPLLVTGSKIAKQMVASCSGLYDFDVIAEPVGKNTAPAVAAAAVFCQQKYGKQSVMVVVSADHYISPLEKFVDITLFGADIAAKNDAIVVYAIKPTRPEVGYGYIEKGVPLSPGNKGEKGFKVVRFVEKPNRETAEKYLASGNFFWNSGMFIWRTDYILQQIEAYIPALFKDTQELLENKCSTEALNNFYQNCPKESIDFGVMEHAKNVLALEVYFSFTPLFNHSGRV
jgi:mannose-1-phosphate guanylyltransferase